MTRRCKSFAGHIAKRCLMVVGIFFLFAGLATADEEEDWYGYDNLPVISTTGSGTVDSSGGRIQLGGAEVAVPINAVEAPTLVQIRLLTWEDNPHPLPSYLAPVTGFYAVSADVSEFELPVRLKFPATVLDSPDGVEGYGVWSWDGAEHYAIPSRYDRTSGMLYGYTTIIVSDPSLPPAGLNSPSGVEGSTAVGGGSGDSASSGSGGAGGGGFGGADPNEPDVRSGCENSGGLYNGKYCECPVHDITATAWDEVTASCLTVLSRSTALTANVGNTEGKLACRGLTTWMYKLCYTEVEGRIANNIRRRNPDIVSLQEVFTPDSLCDVPPHDLRRDKKKVCWLKSSENTQKSTNWNHYYQETRLLWPDAYEIYCIPYPSGTRWDCLGIRKSIIAQVVDRSLIIPGCSADTGAQRRTFIHSSGSKLSVIGGHLASPDEAGNDSCRAQQVQEIFCSTAQDAGTIVMGDLNLDPCKPDGDLGRWSESAAVWNQQIWDREFDYHREEGTQDACYFTTRPNRLFQYSLDHVVSNFLPEGRVCRTLDVAPTPQNANDPRLRLDGGEGCDHYAVLCPNLTLVPTHPIEVTIQGPGKVSSIPRRIWCEGALTPDCPRRDGLACEKPCKMPFQENQLVGLTALACPRCSFTGWSGDCSGTVPGIAVAMNSAKHCTATFGSGGWAKAYGGPDDDILTVGRPTPDGGHLIAGGSVGVAKLDPAGAIQWQNSYTGTSPSSVGVFPVSAGGYIGGAASSDFGANYCRNQPCPWVFGLDSAGTFTWQNTYWDNRDPGGGISPSDYYFHAGIRTSDGGYAIAGNVHSMYTVPEGGWILRTSPQGASSGTSLTRFPAGGFNLTRFPRPRMAESSSRTGRMSRGLPPTAPLPSGARACSGEGRPARSGPVRS